MPSRSVQILINAKNNTAPGVDGAKASISSLRGTVGSIAASFAAVLGPVYLFYKAMELVRGSVAGFNEDAAAGAKLEAVLQSTGNAAGLSAAQLKDYASQLQQTTTFADEVTVASEAVLGSFKKVKGDTFKEAIVDAQDLSTVMNQDLQSSVVQLGKALNDPVQGLKALHRVGVDFSDQQKASIKTMVAHKNILGAQKIILKEVASEFGGAAAAVGKTFGGQLQIAKNLAGELGESLGSALSPAILVVVNAFRASVPTLQTWIGYLGEGILDAMKGATIAFTFAETVIENWRLSFDLAFTQVQFTLTRFGTNVQLTLNWIGKHWRDIFKAIFEYTKTVFENIVSNVMAAFVYVRNTIENFNWGGAWNSLLLTVAQVGEKIKNYWNKFFSDLYMFWNTFDWKKAWHNFETSAAVTLFNVGQKFNNPDNWKFKGLTEGAGKAFDGLLDDFPKLLGRALTPDELELKNKLSDLAGDFDRHFKDKLGPRIAAINGLNAPGGAGKAAKQIGDDAEGGHGMHVQSTVSRFLTRGEGRLDHQAETAKSTRETAIATRALVIKIERQIDILNRIQNKAGVVEVNFDQLNDPEAGF